MFLGHAAHQRGAVNALTGARRCGGRSSRGWSGSWYRRLGSRHLGSRGLCGCGRSGLCRSRGRSSGRRPRSVNHADNRLDRHGLPFAKFDLLQHASSRRGNFRIHLVGGDLEQRLVALDLVAGLLQPLGDSAFENALAHLGHYDIYGHDRSPVLVKILIPRKLLRGGKNFFGVRQKIFFQRRRIRHRRIQ